jgi:hypothetical protein
MISCVLEALQQVSLRFDGIQFSTTVSPYLVDQAHGLLTACAGLVNSPKGLKDGHLVQVGGPMYVVRREGGGWRVLEPDYSTEDPTANPQPDITISLHIQVQQLLFSAMVGIEPQDCGWMERVGYPEEFDWTGAMHMQRYPAKHAGDSGWCILPDDSDASQEARYVHGPIYSLLHRRPVAMTALLLPAGTFTVLDADDQFVGVAGEGDVVLWQP